MAAPTLPQYGTLQTAAGGSTAPGVFMDQDGNTSPLLAGPDASLYQQSGDAAVARRQLDGATRAQLLTPGFQQAQAGQTTLAAQLAAQANGQGASAADIQQGQGIEQALQAQQSAAANAGGNVNPFLMQRQLAAQAGQMQAQAVGQAALQRATETAQARQQLAGVLSSQSQQQLAGAQMQSQQQLAASQLAQGYDQMDQAARLQLSQDTQAARMGTAQFASTSEMQDRGASAALTSGIVNSALGAAGAVASGGLSGVGSALASKVASDENVKTDVDRAHTGAELDDFMGALDPASYNYTDRAYGEGRHYGVMAQSAERSAAGRTMVDKLPGGVRALDMKKALGLALASTARLHDRQARTEALLAAAHKRVK